MTPKVAPRGTQPPAVPSLAYLSDPTDPHYRAAMKRTCEVCEAKPGRPCWNTIDSAEPLPGRLIHHGRLEKSAA